MKKYRIMSFISPFDAQLFREIDELVKQYLKAFKEALKEAKQGKMTAKEMFEELGFTQIILENNDIKYSKQYLLGKDLTEERITFLLKEKTDRTNVVETSDKRWYKAIQKQIQELGWDE